MPSAINNFMCNIPIRHEANMIVLKNHMRRIRQVSIKMFLSFAIAIDSRVSKLIQMVA